MSDLVIISHTKHYYGTTGEVLGWEPTVREIYSGLNNDYVWIRNNRDFYPMGQLISFSVLWNFEN